MTEYRATQTAAEFLRQKDELRATQTAAEFLRQKDDIRVTQVALEVVERLFLPTAPVLYTPPPDGSGGVDQVFRLTYGASFDELDRPITYFAEIKSPGGAWTALFSDREGEETYEEDSSLWAEGIWELRLWAEAGGERSGQVATTFTVNHGWPTTVRILTPVPLQETRPDTLLVTWEHATDPQGDPLTEHARWRPKSSGTWTPLFAQPATDDPEYLWDLTGFAEGDYVLEMYANDGTSDGPPVSVIFTVTEASRPSRPAIRISALGKNSFCIEARAYAHPYGVAWKRTVLEVRPFGGDWANPTKIVSTENAAEMLEVCVDGIATGFHAEVRLYFVDVDDAQGLYSADLPVPLIDTVQEYEARWDESVRWSSREGFVLGENELTPGYKPVHPLGALVDKRAPEIGSVRGSVNVMIGGCQCGFYWERFYDCELRRIGFALAKGTRSDGNEEGVAVYLRSRYISPVSQIYKDAVGGLLTAGHGEAWLGFEAKVGGGLFATARVKVGRLFVRSNEFTMDPFLPFFPWTWGVEERRPIYKLHYEIQRDLTPGNQGTWIRAKAEGPLLAPLPEGEWMAEWWVPNLLVCGRPGFVHGQEGAQPGHDDTADSYFKILDWAALRDLGIEFVDNRDPLDPVDPGEEPPCVLQPEPPVEPPVLFPAQPRSFPVRERVSYLTDVITAEDDTEQRIQLRMRPRGALAYQAAALDGQDVSAIQALLWDLQPTRWGVPLWTDAAYLTEALGAGAGTIPAGAVDTTDRRFEESTHVVLWNGPTRYHFTTATVELDGSITLGEATAVDFKAHRTWVAPVRIARLSEQQALRRQATWAIEMPLDFLLETVLPPAAGDPPPQYQGHDLFTPQPNRLGGEEGAFSRAMHVLDGGTGEVGVEEAAETPVVERSFHYSIEGKAEIAAFRAWLDRRKGRAVPFWGPTWMSDLEAAAPLGGGSTSLVVKAVGYAERLFPDPARRHLAFLLPDQTVIARKVTAAMDNGDGTETLTLASSLGQAFPATGGLISFLPLYRLAEDDTEIEWKSPSLVTVQMRFRELPREVT